MGGLCAVWPASLWRSPASLCSADDDGVSPSLFMAAFSWGDSRYSSAVESLLCTWRFVHISLNALNALARQLCLSHLLMERQEPSNWPEVRCCWQGGQIWFPSQLYPMEIQCFALTAWAYRTGSCFAGRRSSVSFQTNSVFPSLQSPCPTFTYSSKSHSLTLAE